MTFQFVLKGRPGRPRAMSITIDEALHQISLKKLADLSTHELQRRRWDEPGGDRYCVELFRRALVEQTDEAWSALQQCFSETVRSWLWSHPSHDVALLRDSEENYIAQTFSRFWYAMRDQCRRDHYWHPGCHRYRYTQASAVRYRHHHQSHAGL